MTAPVDVVARALLSLSETDVAAPDHLETLEALRSLVDAHHFAQLCEACDVCPVHLCDADICTDDEDPECAYLWEARS